MLDEFAVPPELDSRGKPRVQTEFHDESLTVQADHDRADINKILQQYAEVGIVQSLNQADAMFMDVTEFTDFADAMRHATEAETEFLKLPSKVREIFHHDVAEWLDAAHDEEKRDALVAAGVIKEPEETGEVPVAASRAADAADAADAPGATGAP